MSAVGAALILGAASGAHAQGRSSQPSADLNPAARDAFALNQSQNSQVIELDTNARWGLKLEIQEPVTRDTELRDMEAGAFFKVSPSIRVSGAVGLSDTEAPTAENQTSSDRTTPRVSLGASFRF